MNKKFAHYHAYLLRVWRDDLFTTWRASLEDPHTGQIISFATIERLYDFLDEMMDDPAAGRVDSPDSDH